MSMQDAASGVALWRQVADGIERGIANGTFAPGEKLPGETEIAETYRVNRHTVRRALATLAERGLVRAERGSGTYVEAQRLAYPLRSRTRFSEIVGAGGHEPRGQLIEASEDIATRELARDLGLKTGAPLIRIEALRLADRAPICVSTSWLSAERFPDAGTIFANVRSMTKLLAHYGISARTEPNHVFSCGSSACVYTAEISTPKRCSVRKPRQPTSWYAKTTALTTSCPRPTALSRACAGSA